MFLVVLARLFVCQQDYLQNNERIWMPLLPDMCVWDDPDYDPDPKVLLKTCVSGQGTNH